MLRLLKRQEYFYEATPYIYNFGFIAALRIHDTATSATQKKTRETRKRLLDNPQGT